MRFIQPNSSNARETIYDLLKRRTPQPGGGGGGARDRNTPRTYDRRADLWPAGLSQKGGQIRVRLDAAPDAGQGFEKPDSPPKAGRMATLSNAPLHIPSNANGVIATRENGKVIN